MCKVLSQSTCLLDNITIGQVQGIVPKYMSIGYYHYWSCARYCPKVHVYWILSLLVMGKVLSQSPCLLDTITIGHVLGIVSKYMSIGYYHYWTCARYCHKVHVYWILSLLVMCKVLSQSTCLLDTITIGHVLGIVSKYMSIGYYHYWSRARYCPKVHVYWILSLLVM